MYTAKIDKFFLFISLRYVHILCIIHSLSVCSCDMVNNGALFLLMSQVVLLYEYYVYVTNTRQTYNTRFGQNCLFYYLFGLLYTCFTWVVYIYIIIYISNPKVRSLSADCTVALSASFPFVIYVTSSSSFQFSSPKTNY